MVGNDCLNADALATVLILLGPDRGLELLKENSLCGLIVYMEESGSLAYKATESFLRFMTPDLAGIPIH